MELRGDPDENAFMLGVYRSLDGEYILDSSNLDDFFKDTQILELIGYFKEQATARAKLLIDNYHIQGKLPTQSANSPEFIEDGISYIFACNYDGKQIFVYVLAKLNEPEQIPLRIKFKLPYSKHPRN